jgi:hypothetical protein
MQRDCLSIELISDSLAARTAPRRLAAIMLSKAAQAGVGDEGLLEYVRRRTDVREVIEAALDLVREHGLADA